MKQINFFPSGFKTYLTSVFNDHDLTMGFEKDDDYSRHFVVRSKGNEYRMADVEKRISEKDFGGAPVSVSFKQYFYTLNVMTKEDVAASICSEILKNKRCAEFGELLMDCISEQELACRERCDVLGTKLVTEYHSADENGRKLIDDVLRAICGSDLSELQKKACLVTADYKLNEEALS